MDREGDGVESRVRGLCHCHGVEILERSIALLQQEARFDGILPNRFRTLSDPLLEVLDLDPNDAMEDATVVDIITQLIANLEDETDLESAGAMLEVYVATLRSWPGTVGE